MAKSLLKEIESSKDDILKIIHFDEALLGTFLGFGRENSLLFRRWCEITPSEYIHLAPAYPELNIRLLDRKKHFSLKPIALTPGFQSFEEERAWFAQYFNDGSYTAEDFKLLELIGLVGFRVRKSCETERFIQRYNTCKKILGDLFYNRDIVDVVFEQLNVSHPISVDNYRRC